MSVIGNIFIHTTGADGQPWLAGDGIAVKSHAGATVTPKTALTVSVYLACVKVLAEDVAKLPLIVYRNLGNEQKEAAVDHPAYYLLRKRPNPDMSSMNVREVMQAHTIGWGNGYAEIVRAGTTPRALWPIHPSRVRPARDEEGNLMYDVRGRDVTAPNAPVRLPAKDMLHIRGLGGDGITGYSLAAHLAHALGISMEAEKYASKFYANDARPGIALKHPSKMSPEAYKNLRTSWVKLHQGAGKAYEPAILEEGMDIDTYGINPDEAQFLETRQFQVEEICRPLRMLPQKVMHFLRLTYNNVEHLGIAYWQDTIEPWCVRWEEEIDTKLLDAEGDEYFVQHRIQDQQRGDVRTRFTSYSTAVAGGWMTRNEARLREGLPPLKGLDEPLVPLNMAKASNAAAGQKKATQTGAVPPGDGQSAADVRAACMPMFEDAARRVVAKEVRAAERAVKRYQGDDEALRRWADDFYAKQEAFFVEAMTPPADAMARLLTDGEPVNGLTELVASVACEVCHSCAIHFLLAQDKALWKADQALHEHKSAAQSIAQAVEQFVANQPTEEPSNATS